MLPSTTARTGEGRDRVAVLIPCYNEALTISKVVNDFRRELPNATVYVFDNNSTDDTATLASAAGAIVRLEPRQGKGFVVASMFATVEADIYVMVDGDDTYPASSVSALIEPVRRGTADMVVGTRLTEFSDKSFRSFHVFGNALVVKTVNLAFRSNLHDIMSGYRAFSRRFVEEVPIVSRGFEIETEMTIQALYRDLVIREFPITYGVRPEGSHSKLSTFRDGFRVVLKIVDITKAYRPLLFFGVLGIVIAIVGVLLGSIPVAEFIRTRRIERFPTAILATGLVTVAMLLVTCGLILDGLNHRLKEVSQLLSKKKIEMHRTERAASLPRN